MKVAEFIDACFIILADGTVCRLVTLEDRLPRKAAPFSKPVSGGRYSKLAAVMAVFQVEAPPLTWNLCTLPSVLMSKRLSFPEQAAPTLKQQNKQSNKHYYLNTISSNVC